MNIHPKTISRRNFLKQSAAAGLAVCFQPVFAGRFRNTPKPLLQNIGVCAPLSMAELAMKSGCTYLEEGVRRFLVPEESDGAFEAKLAQLGASTLPVPVCNGFLPGSLKSVGPEAAHEAILSYSETAFRRASRAGVGIVVFGSGNSRKISDGFDRAKAEEQFVALCKTLARLAEKSRVMIALEHLNRGETNWINSLTEGVRIVKRVNHPNFKMLADIYHMLKEDEPPEAIEKAGKCIVHCHIAEKEKRTPPGTAGDDFRPYLQALKKIRYSGKLSLECRWDHWEAQLAPAIMELKKQIAETA